MGGSLEKEEKQKGFFDRKSLMTPFLNFSEQVGGNAWHPHESRDLMSLFKKMTRILMLII